MSQQCLIIILLQVMSMQLLIAENVVGQNLKTTKVSARIKEKRIEEIFKVLEGKTDFVFVFPSEIKGPGRYVFLQFRRRDYGKCPSPAPPGRTPQVSGH